MSTTKRLWIIGATVVGITAIGVLGKMSLAQGEPTAQVAPFRSPETGRYQLSLSGSLNPYVFLLDSKTGRCWQKSSPSDREWREVTPPELGPR